MKRIACLLRRLGAVSGGIALAAVCWITFEARQPHLMSEATAPTEEMKVLKNASPLLSQIERDLAMGRLSLTAASELIAPVLQDSILRNSLQYFPGSSESEKLARMLCMWVETRHASHPTEACENALFALKAEIAFRYPPLTAAKNSDATPGRPE